MSIINENKSCMDAQTAKFEYNLTRAKYFTDTIQITNYEETIDYLSGKIKQSQDDFKMIKYLKQNDNR